MSRKKVQSPFETPYLAPYVKQFYTPREELCKVATNGGKDCKFMLNLRDKNRRLLSCTKYCMVNCTPEQLLPLFDPPKVIRVTDHNNNETDYRVSETTLSFEVNFNTYQLWNRYSNGKWFLKYNSDENVPKGEPNYILYNFLKKHAKAKKIKFEVILFTNEIADKSSLELAGITFDKPYIRNESQWKVGTHFFKLGFELEKFQ